MDIITWLVQKYTSFSIDNASFAHVKARLVIYPASFALLERKNVMEVVADVAYQSRCVVSVRNDVVYLNYASEEPTSVATIAASDVLANSLRVSFSSTDEVATKQVITWPPSGSHDPYKIILKYNVAKYGTHEVDHDYYTLNIFDNALKSATFWMIRDANIWKLVDFKTPLKQLALEVFDCVTLDLPDVSVVPVKAVKAVITSIRYDVAAEEIAFQCWTPLRAGERAPYIHAWPADIPADTIFPLAEERAAGMGYNFNVTPPLGHLLYVDRMADGNPPAVLSSGDPYPSDLGDTQETCFCPSTDDAYVDETDPVIIAQKKAEQAQRTAAAAQTNSGGGGNNDQNKKPKIPKGPKKPDEEKKARWPPRAGSPSGWLHVFGDHHFP